jgi:hypothetical protein
MDEGLGSAGPEAGMPHPGHAANSVPYQNIGSNSNNGTTIIIT